MLKTYDLSFLPKHIDPKEYLKQNIDYSLDDEKIRGLNLFLEYSSEFQF